MSCVYWVVALPNLLPCWLSIKSSPTHVNPWMVHSNVWQNSLQKKKKRVHLQCKRHRRCGFDSWVGKIPWRRKWQPTPVFLPGKFHGQRSLAGYSLWGRKRVGHDWAYTYVYIRNLERIYVLFKFNVPTLLYQNGGGRIFKSEWHHHTPYGKISSHLLGFALNMHKRLCKSQHTI